MVNIELGDAQPFFSLLSNTNSVAAMDEEMIHRLNELLA
jgi:hypothetical protein